MDPNGNTPPNTPPNTPAPTVLKVGDTEYTPEKVKELETRAAKAAELETQTQKLAAMDNLLSTLMSDTATEEERTAAQERLLIMKVGEEQARKILSGGSPQRDTPPKKEKDPNEDKIVQLQRSVEEMNRRAAEEDTRRLEDQLSQELDSAIKSSDLQKFFEGAAREYGEEKAREMREDIVQQLRLGAKRHISRTMETTGSPFKKEFIGSGAKSVVTEYVKRFQPVIRDIALGPSRATVDSETLFVLGKPPVKAPTWKPGMTPEAAEASLSEFFKDTLIRDGARSGPSLV